MNKKIYSKIIINNIIKKLSSNLKKSMETNYIDRKVNLIYNYFNSGQYNNKWDYKQIVYNYNQNNNLNDIKFKEIIRKYLSYIFNYKITINNKIKLINIQYNDINILYYNNKIKVIVTIYRLKYLNGDYRNNDLLFNKVIKNLIENLLNNIINIDKLIEIILIILKYGYLDNLIYSKLISKRVINKNLKGIRLYKLNLRDNFNLILDNYNKNFMINKTMKVLDYNGNYLINNESIRDYLLGKFISGIILSKRGVNLTKVNERSLKSLYITGKLKSRHIYNLNYSNSLVVSKNGIINIKTKIIIS